MLDLPGHLFVKKVQKIRYKIGGYAVVAIDFPIFWVLKHMFEVRTVFWVFINEFRHALRPVGW